MVYKEKREEDYVSPFTVIVQGKETKYGLTWNKAISYLLKSVPNYQGKLKMLDSLGTTVFELNVK